MKQLIGIVAAALAAVSVASAHFPFLVPEPGGVSAKLFLSETLTPDPAIEASYVAGSKLSVRDAQGQETPLTLTPAGTTFTVALPGGGLRVAHGLTDLGVMERSKTHLLLYYPKTILGDPFDAKTKVGDSAAAELVPMGEPGRVTLQLLGRGKALAGAEVTVLLPDGEQKIVKTNASGQTEVFTQEGRYGAWARFWEDLAGERDGKRYEQVRHYATLVFDAQAEDAAARGSVAENVATLPQATSSFGAAVAGDWLYVYGGHVSPTHVYSTEAVSGRFDRMHLTGEPVWEELPGGPGLQGMNIAAHGGLIYRVGGMAPQNKPGEKTDNRSVADCARFDPAAKKWEALPPLPEARSSHDLLVVGDRLVVIGGWTMREGGQDWPDTFLVMDLSKTRKKLAWEERKAPFRRRALMAAGYEGKMYVIGGFTDKNEVVRKVSIYDFESKSWSEGPELPDAGRTVGFAPAAGVHAGRLYVSVSDGSLLRLTGGGQVWEHVATTTPRLAHRLASRGDSVLILGGAADGDNLDLVEAVRME